jgi:hypothetical protein
MPSNDEPILEVKQYKQTYLKKNQSSMKCNNPTMPIKKEPANHETKQYKPCPVMMNQ